MLRKSTLAMALATALGLATPISDAWALGLGALRTQSALNQPFYAEIDLDNVRADELDTLRVRLASPEDFARKGIERPHFLTRLQFTPMVGPAGEPLVQVTSREPVREPFLSFLVEAIWPAGRLLKEYTILLDPPSAATRGAPSVAAPTPGSERRPPPAPTPTPQPARPDTVAAASDLAELPADEPPAAESEEPTPAAEPDDVAAPRAPTVAAPPAAVPPATEVEFPLRYGPVPSGAGLWRIARSMAPPGATVAQTAMALYRSSQDAFLGGNINRLRVGSALSIPSAEELFALDAESAERQFHDAMAGRSVTATPLAPAAARLTIAGDPTAQPLEADPGAPPAVTPPVPESEPELEPEALDPAPAVALAEPEAPVPTVPPSQPEPTADPAPDPAPETAAAPRNSQLVAALTPDAALPGADNATNGPPAAVRNGAPDAAPNGSVTAPPRNDALHNRINELEAQLSTILRLLEARNEELARLQTEPAVPADAVAAAPDHHEDPDAAPGAVGAPEAAPPTPPPAAAEPPPTSSPGLADIPLWPVAGLFGVMALGGLGWLAYRRRGAPTTGSDPEFNPAADAESEMFEVELPASAMGSTESAPNALSTGVSLSASLPQDVRTDPTAAQMVPGTSSALAETREADVLGEADIYILYGRYRDAESLLSNELEVTPERAELRFKLAEAYMGMGQRDALAALVEQMTANGEASIAPAKWQTITQALAEMQATSRPTSPRRPEPSVRATERPRASVAPLRPTASRPAAGAAAPESPAEATTATMRPERPERMRTTRTAADRGEHNESQAPHRRARADAIGDHARAASASRAQTRPERDESNARRARAEAPAAPTPTVSSRVPHASEQRPESGPQRTSGRAPEREQARERTAKTAFEAAPQTVRSTRAAATVAPPRAGASLATSARAAAPGKTERPAASQREDRFEDRPKARAPRTTVAPDQTQTQTAPRASNAGARRADSASPERARAGSARADRAGRGSSRARDTGRGSGGFTEVFGMPVSDLDLELQDLDELGPIVDSSSSIDSISQRRPAASQGDDSDSGVGGRRGSMSDFDLDLDALDPEPLANLDPSAFIGDLTQPVGADLGLHEQFHEVPESADVTDRPDLRVVRPGAGRFDDADAEADDSAEPVVDNLSSEVLSSQWRADSGLWDEAATKIDLARAYVEMNDPDAARAILEEVAQEGSDEQRAEAVELLRQLG